MTASDLLGFAPRPTNGANDAAAILNDYEVGLRRTLELIDPTGPPDRSVAAIRRRAADRLRSCRDFLAYLGDPQERLRTVHVTGTSGKGSTSAMIAEILRAAGYRVGLLTSPYLQAATEKVQVDGELIHANSFRAAVERTLEAGEAWRARTGGVGRVGYGECWVALALDRFLRERVDVAVVEVGAGGRFDLTNVVRPAVAVITGVGLDHLATLGPTLADIAWHKAGIVKPGARVVTGAVDPVALAAIAREAEEVGAPVRRLVEGESFRWAPSGEDGVARLEMGEGAATASYRLGMTGRFQAANAAVAVEAARALSPLGFAMPAAAVERGLARARLPGRAEAMPTGDEPPVLLDGAHNPEKIRALRESLEREPSLRTWRRPVAVVGLIAGKDAQAVVAALAPHVSALIATTTGALGKTGLEPDRLAVAARAVGFQGPILVEPKLRAALEVAIGLARERDAAVLVTGSLFLVGAARERWYPSADIVLERTPWPRQRAP